ncbi:MAG: NAD(P)(+) transhydrogenase (Re/Si-specific) subunit beta [Candidatus Omnitrophica bacterium]|nr:NAD(P)(+) transhydrogenase (Re/Si-specific) subunit beta [Candidatus Omnitrophota bacterium]
MNAVFSVLYLIASAFFILGLKYLGSPKTAVKGNGLAAFGMGAAILVTFFHPQIEHYGLIVCAIAVGTVAGIFSVRIVQMTQMPQMVALFNGLGGGASALVGAGEYIRQVKTSGYISPDVYSVAILSLLIGAITFSGSMVAFAKLQGIIKGTPVSFPFQKLINLSLFIAFPVYAAFELHSPHPLAVSIILMIIALAVGKLTVLPIGGADMPVVISLLNSLSGVAASIAGFVIMNEVLIISGALVGASGLILTQIMCKAMNRSLWNVIFGNFGAAKSSVSGAAGGEDRPVRSVSAEEASMVLGYASKVVIVPGYGMAVAQAQHAVREVSDLLEERGVDVKFAIHPVAGRMPGHMNVLLAEANVPYPQLKEMEEINPDFPKVDVVLIIGANDVVNPAARENPGSPIYGMPVLEVDKAKTVIVIKRGLNPGFAGIENELFYRENTMMLFGSAKGVLENLAADLKVLD